jgi:hypothetical protein
MVPRRFYHSFPRIRPDDEYSETIATGLEILASIKTIGLILAPEIIEWKQPLSDGSYRTTFLLQRRICFTELEASDVPEHAKKFGPLSIEFSQDILRELGALPVFYVPQGIKDDRSLSNAGATVVTQLADIKYTINQLRQLSQFSNPEYLVKHFAPQGATHVDEKCMLNLTNVDEQNKPTAVYPFSIKSVRDILSYIGYKNAPFDLMEGVLSLMQNLFYPTDDAKHDEKLAYYQQREWRLVPGLCINNTPQGRTPTLEEKMCLLKINNTFWSKELHFDKCLFPRIEKAYVIDSFEGRPVAEAISRIFVPPDAYNRAVELFGDKVVVQQQT